MITVKLTDTMSQIQTKLKGNKEVKFTKGTYKITKQLIIYPDTIIDLNGSTLQRCANIQSIFLNYCTSTTKKYTGAGNIVIKNGTFEGMGSYSIDNLVTFFHSHDLTIMNVTFKDILCHGLELNSTQNVVVDNCKFLGRNVKEKTDAQYDKEAIQIDYAGYSAFVLSGTTKLNKCYDGTMCKDIKIINCIFDKSKSRPNPYVCIGNHTQVYGGFKHKNIYISDCEFNCNRDEERILPAISLIGMEDVTIKNCKFNSSRAVRIYNKAGSHTVIGGLTDPMTNDGQCNNIAIAKNTISGCSKSNYVSVKNKTLIHHSNIKKSDNIFV